jgi:hypothetical protein
MGLDSLFLLGSAKVRFCDVIAFVLLWGNEKIKLRDVLAVDGDRS